MATEPVRLRGLVRAVDRINLFLVYLGMVLTALLFANIVVNVALRKLFDAPIIWSVDVAQYLMVYLTFLPAAWLLLHDGHVRMTLVLDQLRGGRRRGAIIVADIVVLLYSGVLAWQGWLAAHHALASDITFPTISAIPEFPVLVAIPVCAAWLCLSALVKLVAFVGRDPRLPDPESDDVADIGGVAG